MPQLGFGRDSYPGRSGWEFLGGWILSGGMCCNSISKWRVSKSIKAFYWPSCPSDGPQRRPQVFGKYCVFWRKSWRPCLCHHSCLRVILSPTSWKTRGIQQNPLAAPSNSLFSLFSCFFFFWSPVKFWDRTSFLLKSSLTFFPAFPYNLSYIDR